LLAWSNSKIEKKENMTVVDKCPKCGNVLEGEIAIICILPALNEFSRL